MNQKYYTYFFLIAGLLLVHTHGFSQDKRLWSKVDAAENMEQLLESNSIIKQQQLFALDEDQLKNKLQFNSKSNKTSRIVEFPDTDGNLMKFMVNETAILHAELAKKFPTIKSYRGQGVDDESISIHFSTSKLGLYAMVLSPQKGTMFIDPYTKNRKKYSVYYKRDVVGNKDFECSTIAAEIAKIKSNILKSASNDLKLRTFRLAIATTEEYSTFHVDAAGLNGSSTRTDSINAVLSAIVVTMNRVNPIFERDIALTMQLVANNDQIIYLETDPGSDPYTNNDGSAMLTQNQNTINSVIGSANYDIGHVFSTGGGGVANLASVCGVNKAKGVTGSNLPVGNGFDIDYVAHEMGHQFGANHTFNGNAGNCGGGNRNNATAVEPGSGSTLMGYAGICGSQNIQGNSDSYFSIISIEEIYNNISSGGSQCAVVSNFTFNMNVPIADAGGDFTIPKSTPFVLQGQGSDADGNVLTYCWEQLDNEVGAISIPPSSTQTQGAIFRSFPPKTSSRRYLPSLQTLVSGNGTATWEVLPSVSRAINFALTVRDNVVGEGQTVSDNATITVNDAAGPFLVTSQNTTGISWEVNDSKLITWDVAGTNANGINVNNVNIRLSTDGGITFPTLLAVNTPNDGFQSIIVPNLPSPNARIMVEAVGNVFFNLNTESFLIGSFVTTCDTYNATGLPVAIPDFNPTGVTSVVNVNDNFTISDVNVNIDITHPYIWDLRIFLKAPNGTEVLIYDKNCGTSSDRRQGISAVFDDNAPSMICINSETIIPAITGITKPANFLSTFNGLSSLGEWKLRVVDNGEADSGIINSWSLQLCETNPTVSVDDNSFNEFNVYPNPSKGQIELRLNASNAENVQVKIYDLSGRQVFASDYTNTDTKFNKQLNLNSLAKGVYFLKVIKGKATGTKKVILY